MDQNLTAEDAHFRVYLARVGSFVGASDDFLLALASKLRQFAADCDCELQRRVDAASRAEEQGEGAGQWGACLGA